ncbi:MAG: COX15/CtaA family protein [Alphaproteobacteria bacterium]
MQSGLAPTARLPALAIFMAYVVIVLGAATRVWDAGMSCPDWPHCYGTWWPWSMHEFVVGERHYTAFQVALEWSHRLLAALTGLVVLPMVVLGWKRPHLRVLGLAILAVLALQVKLGAVTVWFNNVNWSVAVHLGNAMIFIGLLAWYKKLTYAPVAVSSRLWAVSIFAILVLLTMVVGATVSSSHAGGICGGLPSCAGVWWPAGGLEQVHVLHRLLAVGVLLASVLLMIFAKKSGNNSARRTAKGLHVLVWGQVAFGVATLYSFEFYPAWYEWLSVAHLAWGTLLWLAAVGAVLKARYGAAGPFHG